MRIFRFVQQLNKLIKFQTNKPIMEKKRRARINQCLGELKELILEAMKKDVSSSTIPSPNHLTIDQNIEQSKPKHHKAPKLTRGDQAKGEFV